MFARRYNELHLTLQIAPDGPLLIKEGRHIEGGDRNTRSFHRGAARDPARPRRRDGRGYGQYDSADDAFDMACVWTQTATGAARFYLPGSSLRGVLRSAAEQLVGRWQPEWTWASDPFNNAAQGWVQAAREHEQRISPADIYQRSGPIERCFGHTALRGRWRIDDARMDDERAAKVVVRDGVGIDRHTGAAANNIKFQYEAITGGVFQTTITLVNYELWQLGLLAHVLAQLDGGESRLGYGTRRGLGRVRLAVPELRFVWYGAAPHQEQGAVRLPPLAAQAGAAAEAYDLRDAGCRVALPLEADTDAVLGSAWRLRPALDEPNDAGFRPSRWSDPTWEALAGPLDSVLSNWQLSDDTRPFLPREAQQ